jgi:hypothetical protein
VLISLVKMPLSIEHGGFVILGARHGASASSPGRTRSHP